MGSGVSIQQQHEQPGSPALGGHEAADAEEYSSRGTRAEGATQDSQRDADGVSEMPEFRSRRRSSFDMMKDALAGLARSWSQSGGERDSSFSYRRKNREDRRNSRTSASSGRNRDGDQGRSQSVLGTMSILDTAAHSDVGDGADGSALVIQTPALVDEDGNTMYSLPETRRRMSD
jgi:hypothetical protein